MGEEEAVVVEGGDNARARKNAHVNDSSADPSLQTRVQCTLLILMMH